jgi:hypothetical protein
LPKLYTQGRTGYTLALVLASIHPSAWKGCSANFACAEFSEIHAKPSKAR